MCDTCPCLREGVCNHVFVNDARVASFSVHLICRTIIRQVFPVCVREVQLFVNTLYVI